MKVLTRLTITWVIAIVFAAGFAVLHSDAQTTSAKTSKDILRERIATIFRETFKQLETRIEVNGQWITATTFSPPTTEHVEEIRRYGDEAIPILSEYLNQGTGWEKYLAMRFLGSIGGKSIIDPLRRVALHDPSPNFRTDALLWLSGARWDLAAPIIRQAARKDRSPEVRKQAQAILAQH
jgi:HEAT repeat protein